LTLPGIPAMGHGVKDLAHNVKDGADMRIILAGLNIDVLRADIMDAWRAKSTPTAPAAPTAPAEEDQPSASGRSRRKKPTAAPAPAAPAIIPDASVLDLLEGFAIIASIWQVSEALFLLFLIVPQLYESLISHVSTRTGHPRRLDKAVFEEKAALLRRYMHQLWGNEIETPYLHILFTHMADMCEK